MEFTVDWVGDKTNDYNGVRTYTTSLKDPNGAEIKKVKLERPLDAAAPTKGEVIEGTVEQHPRFSDAKLFKAAGTESPAQSSTPPSTGESPDARQGSIERQVAAKSAAEIVTAEITAGKLEPAAVVERFGALTSAIVATIQGGQPAQGNAQAPQTGQPASDDDIPF